MVNSICLICKKLFTPTRKGHKCCSPRCATKLWLKEHEQYHYNKNKTNRVRNRQFIQRYKLMMGCSICGYNKCAGALDFHHLREIS